MTAAPPPPPSMRLPISAGGRPAFGAQDWLVSLHYHAQSGLPGASIHANAGVGACASMRAAAHMLRTTHFDINQVIDGWKDLPVVLHPIFVRDWETNKPWRQWPIADHKITAYQSLLDSASPSSGYLPGDFAVAKDVWSAALRHMPPSATFDMLDHAADTWMQWAREHPEVSRFQRAMDTLTDLGASLGMDPDQCITWARLELWWMSLAADMPVFGAYLLQATAAHAPIWFGACAAAIGVHEDEMQSLFSPSGPLVGNGLYNALARTDGQLSLPGRERDIGARLDEWATKPWAQARRDLVRTAALSWEDLVQPQAQVIAPVSFQAEPSAAIEPGPDRPALDATQWSHLQDTFEQSVAALKNNAGLRILIVGAPGTGKTRLCQDLLAAANLSAQFLLTPAQDAAMTDPDAVLARLKCASWACLPTASALVIDNPENLFDSPGSARFLANAHRHPIIVIADDLARFSSAARTGFDRIIWLEAMPLAQRLALASGYFTDETLALRVARALRTPKAIIEAARWCRSSGAWTWDAVQSHARAASRATPKTQDLPEQFEIEPVADPSTLPPMAGNQQLVELANRLCLAFEQPQAFAALGAIPPKGAMLLGPPGTGKTLFARHLAARLSAPLIAPDPSMLAKHPDQIGPLFEFARRHAPCVLLLDEAEPLVCLQPLQPPPPALAALLSEIDGAQTLDGVMVIATSNNPMVAPPLLRSGRLSEVRTLDVPLQEDRQAIWQAYLANRPVSDEGLDEPLPQALARASRGLTGADIADTLRRAAGEAVAAGETALSLPRLLRACDDVRWASADGRDSVCPQERRAVAIHEAGHALLAWRHGLEVQRITVRSRARFQGMVQWDHIERRHEQSRAKAFGRLQMTLGGIAAEKALLGEYGSGGSSDLEHALDEIHLALAKNGLGGLGPMSAGRPDHRSEQLRQRLEAEASLWSRSAFDEAVSWLTANAAMVNALADALLQAGDLSGPDLLVYSSAVASLPIPLPTPPPPYAGPLSATDPGAPRMSGPSQMLEPTHRLHSDPAMAKDQPHDADPKG